MFANLGKGTPKFFRFKAAAILLFLLLFTSFKAEALNWPIGQQGAFGVSQILLQIATRFHKTKLDCSHFVHDTYKRVGLTYDYLDSRSIFKVTNKNGFRRVLYPRVGDLIVWRGHMGIVVDPDQHTFVSAQRTGVLVDSYESRYWKRRGQIRFYRYVIPTNGDPQWETKNNIQTQSNEIERGG